MLWTTVWGVYLGIMKCGGIPIPGVVIWTAYLAVILAIRIKWGYEKGCVWARLVMALIVVIQTVPLFITSSGLLGTMFATFFSSFVGFAFGIVPLWIVHGVVSAVDWIDRLMETKTPPDQ